MMYYVLTEFYYKDIYFSYSDRNEFDYLDAQQGKVAENKELLYEIEEIDGKIGCYDILPTLGLPLVSKKFVEKFMYLLGEEIVTFPACIIDNKGNVNRNFLAIYVVNCYKCIDLNKSSVKYKTYRSGIKSMRIVDLYLDSEKVGTSSIFRLKEKNGYTIVTKEFKDKCGSFNGLHFQEINL
ncbi:DUF1629 domain-containing protein [Vibrio rotiferianus]|uniref:imm11 family protein n=1 Tax=Vibrio rotiferianus TaxID=190895 RepID=UPI0033945104